MIVEGNYLLSYYTQNPILNSNTTFKSILDVYFQKQIPSIIDTISTTDNNDKFKELLSVLPKNVISIIVENSVIAKIKGVYTAFRDKILEFYKYSINDLTEIKGSLLYIHSIGDELRCLNDIEKGWENCSINDINFYNSSRKEKRKTIAKAEKNPYGYYGKINDGTKEPAKLDKFCIAEVDEEAQKIYLETKDTRKLKTGVVCGTGTWNKKELLKLVIIKLKIPIPEVKQGFKDTPSTEMKKNKDDKIKKIKNDFNIPEMVNQLESIDENEANRILFWMNQTKDTLCDSIRKFFEAKGLLYKDSSCGSSKKQNKKTDIEEEESEGGAEETKG